MESRQLPDQSDAPRRLLQTLDPSKSWPCAKRGCDALNPPYLTFGTRDGKTWCLHHRPLRARLRVWWQERRNP